MIKNGSSSLESTALATIDSYDKVTLNEGSVNNTSHNGIVLQSTGSFEMNDGSITATGDGVYSASELNTPTNPSIKIISGSINAGRFGVYNINSGYIDITGGQIVNTNHNTAAISNQTGTTCISEEAYIEGGTKGIYSTTGQVIVKGGTVKSTVGEGIYVTTGTITIGDNTDNTVASPASPIIMGNLHGVQKSDSTVGALNFYDGIIKVPTGNPLISGTVSDTPTGYSVKYGTTTENGIAYDTAYLSNVHNVTLDADGGTIPATTDYTVAPNGATATKSITYGGTYGTLPTPTKPGYTFNGWGTDDNLISRNINDWEVGAILDATGQNSINGNLRLRLKDYVKVAANSTYTINTSGSVVIRYVYLYDTNKNFISTDSNSRGRNAVAFTTPSNCRYIRVVLQKQDETVEIALSELTSANIMLTGSVTTDMLIPANDIYCKANWTANTYKLVHVSEDNILTNGSFEDYTIANAPSATGNGVTHTWDGSLNGCPNDSTKAYAMTGWGTGSNMGVPVPEIGYHAHMKIVDNNSVLDFKTNEAYNGQTGANVSDGVSVTPGTVTTMRWLGASQLMSINDFTAGKEYTITMDVYRVSGNSYIQSGLYYAIGTSTNRDFYSGKGSFKPSKTGSWETISWTFTVRSDYNRSARPIFYIYGNYGSAGECYVDNVRLEETTSTSKAYNTTYTSAELATPTRTGYIFDGWYNDANYTTELSTSTIFNNSGASFENTAIAGSNAYIYAKWTANTYAITLNNQSATTAGTTTIYEKYNDGYYLNNSSGTVSNKMSTSANGITVPTKSGYTFGGYYTATNGGGTQFIDANGKLTSSASARQFSAAGTLYAKWEKLPLQIGDSVDYSTTLNGVTLDDWKVFYKETKNGVDYTYIILGDYLPNAAVSSTVRTTHNLANGDGIYSIKSAKNRGNLLNAMTTKSNWDELLTGTLNGTTQVNQTRTANVWAMGAPTLDLWVNSWNAKYPSDTLYTKYENPVSGQTFDGWYIGNTEKPTAKSINLSSKTGYGNTLYYPHQAAEQSCYGYWLASPSAYDANAVMYVPCYGYVTSASYSLSNIGFRPVVCLPSSVLE